MNNLKILKKHSKGLVDKKILKKIRKINKYSEKIETLKHSMISSLRLKHLDLEIYSDENNKDNYLHLKIALLPSKINLLYHDFNEKDFKKILSLFDELEKRLKNV